MKAHLESEALGAILLLCDISRWPVLTMGQTNAVETDLFPETVGQ